MVMATLLTAGMGTSKYENKFRPQVYLSTCAPVYSFIVSPCTPEAHARAVIGRRGVVAHPDAQVHIICVFRAAAHEAVVHALIDITRPLPDVAGHVVQAVGRGRVERLVFAICFAVVKADGTGARAEAAHVLEGIAAGVEVGILAADLLAPREGTLIRAAGGFLPFYLGWQAPAVII